jgi:hypothetical protein
MLVLNFCNILRVPTVLDMACGQTGSSTPLLLGSGVCLKASFWRPLDCGSNQPLFFQPGFDCWTLHSIQRLS